MTPFRPAGLLASLVLLLALPSLASADAVVNDDQIVRGSQCVGIDCADGESFGFDTVRLKENNLRLGFDDTSTGAFPANDWELTANDSASGGASFFGIRDVTGNRNPFRVDAGAPDNALHVDPQGDLALGASSADLDLQIKRTDTPGVRLEQDNSGGFTAQTWDVAGNEANFFVRDLTNGSRLSFRIRPGAPTSSLDIRSNGAVGVGTASPAQPLHVQRSDGSARLLVDEQLATAAERVLADLSNNGPATLRFTDRSADAPEWLAGQTAGGDFALRPETGGAPTTLRLTAFGDVRAAAAFGQNADPAAAENEQPVDEAATLAALRSLPLATREFTADPSNARHLWPSGAAFRTAFGLGADDGVTAPSDLAGVALASVKALDARVSAFTGPPGPAGANGTQGPQGLRGARGAAASTKRIRALERVNRSQTRRLRALERTVRRLSRRR